MSIAESNAPTYEALRRWLTALLPLSPGEWASVERVFHPGRLDRGDPFVFQGDVRRRVAYVGRGVLHHSVLRDGAEHVVGFDFEGEVTGDFGSFFDGAPAISTITAIEDTDLLILSHEDFRALSERVPALRTIRPLVAERLLEGARARSVEMQQFSAEERYRRLLHRSPHVLQRVPLYLIASYLGVTPEALSRIRRRLV